jgi:hypothetical protein
VVDDEHLATLIDRDSVKSLFDRGFTFRFDDASRATTPYAIKLFETVLGGGIGTVVRVQQPKLVAIGAEVNHHGVDIGADAGSPYDAPDLAVISNGKLTDTIAIGDDTYILLMEALAIVRGSTEELRLFSASPPNKVDTCDEGASSLGNGMLRQCLDATRFGLRAASDRRIDEAVDVLSATLMLLQYVARERKTLRDLTKGQRHIARHLDQPHRVVIPEC